MMVSIRAGGDEGPQQPNEAAGRTKQGDVER
jgi:hypothetical protein